MTQKIRILKEGKYRVLCNGLPTDIVWDMEEDEEVELELVEE